jgi:hypothetical protein
MHLTLAQLLPSASAAVAAWLMVRAGAAKGMLVVRAPSRCAACGKRRTGGRCGCTEKS